MWDGHDGPASSGSDDDPLEQDSGPADVLEKEIRMTSPVANKRNAGVPFLDLKMETGKVCSQPFEQDVVPTQGAGCIQLVTRSASLPCTCSLHIATPLWVSDDVQTNRMAMSNHFQ